MSYVAAETIKKRYKDLYDWKAKQVEYQVGDWLFISSLKRRLYQNRPIVWVILYCGKEESKCDYYKGLFST